MNKQSGSAFLAFVVVAVHAFAADISILSWDRQARLTWTNAFAPGVCTIESAPFLSGPWRPVANYFTTNSCGEATLFGIHNEFLRLCSVDISPKLSAGYTNLLQSYGRLETIAGSGAGGADNISYWQADFEAGYATNAALSRPHFAMADDWDNVYVVDKNSHAVFKVTPDGRIYTVAGTHSVGNGPDYPTNALAVDLDSPNGLWVQADGTCYILDNGNNKIRRVSTDGLMSTLVSDTNGISQGRGLWVRSDEQLVYYASGTELKKWTPSGGVQKLSTGFNELGNLVVNTNGMIVATDRGANKVYLVNPAGGKGGGKALLFGNGKTNAVVDGTLAATNSLFGVRGVWLLPTGGYLLATHEGSQLLYVDSAGFIHILVDGVRGAHSGDGEWFHSPGMKISELRAVTMDGRGNILITENDSGYIRRVQFLRMFQ